MANEEHVAILKQGVEPWNQWREENPGVRPDLRGADLEGANLEGANLEGTKLSGVILKRARLGGVNIRHADLRRSDLSIADVHETNLTSADLSGANFFEADLSGAILSRATLRRAKLVRTDLWDAEFWYADLWQADLQAANLTKAKLSGGIFTEVQLGMTIFGMVDLRNVHGLETVVHHAPSSIGIDTLYRSRGQIPEVFLRGCGVPDSMIEYARALVAAEHPIDYYSVFISYSSHDEALAKRLHADLQAAGVRCWFAPHDLIPGTYYVRGIDEAIRLHDKVVLLLSEASIKSNWVLHEIITAQTREAREGRIVLYPVRLDDTVLTTAAGWAAELRDARHIGDFRRWKEHDAYQQAFARLLRDLRTGGATR